MRCPGITQQGLNRGNGLTGTVPAQYVRMRVVPKGGLEPLVIALVLGAFFFGAKRLPEIARSLGKSMQEFKRGVAGETAESESPTPPSPPPAVAVIAPHTCGSCQSPLEPEWKHCPRCGASTESGSTPALQPSR